MTLPPGLGGRAPGCLVPAGVKQLRADADEAARRFAAAGIMAPIAGLCQGLALVLSRDPMAPTRP